MNYATDDLERTFRRGDYVKITGFNTPAGSSRKAVSNSIFGIDAYIYDLDWSEPRVTHYESGGLYLRGGWDMTLVDAPDATPETGFVTRWKQGEDGGQARLIRTATEANES
tara:strand:- start:1058 stop:1390 length:333 start_codon:yes stop_codon:yes gene_type:complete